MIKKNKGRFNIPLFIFHRLIRQELFTKKGGLRSLRLGFEKYFYGINSMLYDNQKSYSKRLTASGSRVMSTQTSNFQ
jgi:hypothetical protein